MIYLMKKFKINFFRYSLNSILVNWPQKISIEISNDINSLCKVILNNPDILEFRKGYCSLLIIFKSKIIDYNNVCDALFEIHNNLKVDDINVVKKSIWEIPVCYEKQFSNDLDEYSKKISLPKDEIIQIHSSKIYYIHMYGFLPGFMYLGGLDSKLFLKRKNIPSRRVIKGSVAIGGTQTGIYPSNCPGGWYVIGNTPLNLFNTSNSTKPVIIPDANYIKFIPVSAEEYSFIEYSVKHLKYKLQKKDYSD